MRRPGFLADAEPLKPAAVSTPGQKDWMVKESPTPPAKWSDLIGHDAGADIWMGMPDWRSPREKKEGWLKAQLLYQVYLPNITSSEREMLLSNYDTLKPAMEEHYKWVVQAFKVKDAVPVPSCSNERAAYLRNRAKTTGPEAILSMDGGRLTGELNTAFRKCLLRANPSPIHKMLESFHAKRKAKLPYRVYRVPTLPSSGIPTEYPTLPSSGIPTEYLIIGGLLAILLLRK